MAKKVNKTTDENFCCDPISACCKVESIVTVSSKGQIVLSPGIQESMNLKKGDKLVSVLMNANTESPLVVLMKADNFGGIVRNFLGPIMKDVFTNIVE
jgi:bifunctional DNA-binding transcriptional regulator/antitoxin component of YhaV-PrlF toxin-antitoxin module